jgi:hypothetical protein
MIASAAAMAVSMPASAQGNGKGGGKEGGGGKPAHAEKADKGHGGGHGGQGGGKPEKAHKMDQGFAGQDVKPVKAEKQQATADRDFAKAERKADKDVRKADKRFAKEEERLRGVDPRFDNGLFGDDRDLRDGRRFAGADGGCPPGLAKKGNGCMPPGQARKAFRVGELLPAAYLPTYNLPQEYRGWFSDNQDYSYRHDDGNIYRVDRRTNLISSLIPLLGGGFGVGNLLPSGFDAYNLPMQYRDDFADSPDSLYRYGDNAIYRVDPHSQMIEGVVALLAGNLNVGQALPSGYDAYNLPMQYRDQYQDSDRAMYRYADNNIYQIDPKTRIIEQIVAMLT